MGIYRMYTGPDNETHIEELPPFVKPADVNMPEYYGARYC